MEELEERIRREVVEPEKVVPEEIFPEEVVKKIFIEKIIVEGVTLIPEEEIRMITSNFEGRELSLRDIQKVADLISDEYRKRNYLTSRAFVPPQTIEEATLLIRATEGRLGVIKIEGNRYFRTRLLEGRLNIEPGEYFDYSALQRALARINEHPDRFVRATLLPGKEPGTTDIIFEVEDRLPAHVSFEYDNIGSRYIGRHRGSVVFEHNNFLGFDAGTITPLDVPLIMPLRFPQPLNPPGFVYFNAEQIWPPKSNADYQWLAQRIVSEHKNFIVQRRQRVFNNPLFSAEGDAPLTDVDYPLAP